MTDLPQHEAIVSIMRHMHDPAYGFDAYYAWALDRTLYDFPYFLALGLAYIVPVKVAMHITVLLAVISYPVGILMALRAMRRPIWIGLLAMPLVYNRAFFWGFINFCFGVGLAFMALSLLVGTWSRRRGWLLMGLCLLTAVNHVYGLLVIFAYSAGWLVSGRQRELLRRLLWTLPALLTLVGWGIFAAKAPGYGTTEWLDVSKRIEELGHSILGGYVDDSENLLLWGWIAATVMLASASAPVTWSRFKRLSVHTRAAYLFIIVNVVAYFMLPVATPAAKFIHFRHAVLAAMMMPLIIERVPTIGIMKRVSWLAAAVACFALTNSWIHLTRFEKEARSFDSILSSIPARSNIVQLTYDSKGSVMRTHAYLHFGAYAQALRGGVFAVSFPSLFWNIPVKGREGSHMPGTPKNLEWAPSLFSERRMGRFYDTILTRNRPNAAARPQTFDFHSLQVISRDWRLYRSASNVGSANQQGGSDGRHRSRW